MEAKQPDVSGVTGKFVAQCSECDYPIMQWELDEAGESCCPACGSFDIFPI